VSSSGPFRHTAPELPGANPALRPGGLSHDQPNPAASIPGAARLAAWTAGLAGLAAMLTGSTWLAAWLGGVAAAWSASGQVTTKTNMAVSQLLAGAALLLLRPAAAVLPQRSMPGNPTPHGDRSPLPLAHSAGTALAFIVLVIGAMTLSEHLSHFNLGIDQLLATEAPGATATMSPNRMGYPGSVSLILLGSALLALAWNRPPVAAYLGLAVCVVNVVPAVGFLLGVQPFFTRPVTGIAWPTVVAMSVLGLGLVAAQRDSGPMALLMRDDAGGALLRSMLPAAMFLPLALGYLSAFAQDVGAFDAETGQAVSVVSTTVVFTLILSRFALQLSGQAAVARAAEESIRNQAEVMDQAYDALIVRQVGGVIRAWNHGAEELYGWSAAEALGRNSHELLHTPPTAVHEFKTALEQTGRWEGELLHITRDGRSIAVEARQTATRTEDGRVLILESNRDITARKRAEEAVRQSQLTLADLIERSPFGTYVVDADFRIAVMNASSQEGAFRNVRPVIGRDFSEAMRTLWPEPVAAEIVGHFRHTLETGEPYCSPRFSSQRADAIAVESYEWELHRIALSSGHFGVICYYYDSTKLREAEAALRAKEADLTEAQRLAHIGSWRWDAKTDRTIGSDELLRIYGFDPATQTMPDFKEQRGLCYPVEEWERVNAAVQRTLATGVSYELDVRAIRGGTALWVTARGESLRDLAGQIAGLRGTVQDITDRKQAEADLRQLNAELEQRVADRTAESREASRYARSLIEASLDPLVTISAEGKITDVNDASIEATGVPREELIGADFSDCFTEPAKAREGYRRVFAEGFVRDYPLVIRHVSGRLTHVLYNARGYRNEAGEVQGVFAAARDVTERKRAEEAANAERRRLKDALDQLPAYLVLLSPDYRVPFANSFFEERFGRSQGKRCYEYLFHRTAPCENCESFKVLATGQPHHWEWTGPDGRDYDVHDFPFTDTDGSPLIMEVGVDVTVTKQAQMALRQLNATLEQRVAERTAALSDADRRKNEFIAILSHELRNPLAPIRYAMPLLAEERLGDAGRRATAVIDRQVTHLARLVDDLLDVSRITTGKVELRTDSVTLDAVLRAAVEAASPSLVAAQHSFDIAVPDAPVWLHADPARIAQAVTNLLNNSAKYTPKGGRIRLEATAGETDVVIRVIDNGVGIAADALPTVFEMFRQVNGTNRSQGGLGIGLTLAKQFVEMHGGTIDARSAGEGQGAEFVVRLPRAPAAGGSDETRAAQPGGQAARLRVLLVDDNVDLVEMLAVLVETSGHQVRKAFDGRSAISAALEYQPHVVLLDVGMPDMSGIDVAKELRRHPELAGTRIVALTGWGQAEDRLRTTSAGFDDHVTKPADPRQIQQILDQAAERMAASRTVW
jgi:PAS domain S-box-containing protein